MKLAFYYLAVALAIIKLNFDVYHGDDIKQLKNGERNKRGAFLTQRDGSELMVIENTKTWYLAELQFGQNKDTVGVLIDTGSSDLWLHAHDVFCAKISSYYSYKKRDSEIVKAKEIENQNKATSAYYYTTSTTINWSRIMSKATSTNTCTEHGSFNTADSDSYHANDTAPPFEIYYYDGTFARGTWGYDSVFFGDVEVKDLSFAVANFTDSEMGVFGIGLPGLEMTYDYRTQSGYQYENFPMKLKSQGLIDKNVYSLYLDRMSADSGTVLFGAVDHAKYEGQLQTVPMTGMTSYSTTNTSAVRTQVILSGATFLSNDQNITISEGRKYNAILDSGSTLSHLPSSLLYKLTSTLNLDYSSSYGAYKIPCTNDPDVKIEFDFNGATIKVPLIDLMIPTKTGECILGLLSGDLFIVGNNILRSGYFVFDLDDEEISMAQVKYTNDEDIEVVSSTIPSAVRIAQYSSTDTGEVSYASATDSITATYSTGSYSVDDAFYSAIWGLSSTTTSRRGSSDKSTVGFIASLVGLVLTIIFL